ncbi:hypothetical protein predicted by Glimmer/Critica [Lactiplantibacillus plantarum]|nr:hypothetical protein predicted by Glimmer/Critica [Lactiplantibacillus plantarum]
MVVFSLIFNELKFGLWRVKNIESKPYQGWFGS